LGITPRLGDLLVVDRAPSELGGDKILYIFDGGTLGDDNLARIAFMDGEIGEYRYLSATDVDSPVPARLARRIRTALEAKHNRHATYAEHGSALPSPAEHGIGQAL
jgi:hypothetical protein